MRVERAVILMIAVYAASASAAVPDQDWVGTIHCGTIPDLVRIPLNQPFRLEIRGGIARYQRNIRVADSSADSGYKENGEGEVRPDGALALVGNGAARASSYRAEFKGVLGPSGQARLDGVQHWRFDNHAPFDRACRLDLRRQG